MGGLLPQRAPGGAVRSVTELTLALQRTIAAEFGEVWVRGQVTGARRVSSGHVYFALKDEGAVLPAVAWRSTASRLRFAVEDGLEVVCRGNIDVYPPHGKYQLVVHEMNPLGVGALQVAFEQLKQRLAAEGLFDPARKVPLPYLPRRVALVTARTGAAVRDLVTVIQRRYPPIEIVLVAVRVQGAGAAEEIARGLRLADRASGADVIVVGRGGGSAEDLWAFNEEPVARAIAACVTPVVSAVGHEVDVTIADLVADVRAATPSQAGELVVPVHGDLVAELDRRASRLRHLVRTRVDRAWQALEGVAGRPVVRDPLAVVAARRGRPEMLAARLASRSPSAELARRRQAAADLAARARRALDAGAARARAALTAVEARLAAVSPVAAASAAAARVADLGARASAAARRRLDRATAGYEARRAAVEALSPLKVLGRGWSLTRLEGALVKTVAAVRPGDRLATEVADGTIESRVEAVRPARPSVRSVAVPPAVPPAAPPAGGPS